MLMSCDSCAHALMYSNNYLEYSIFCYAQEPGLEEYLQADAAVPPGCGRSGLPQDGASSAGLQTRHAGLAASKGAPVRANTLAKASSDAATPGRPASAESMEEAATPWPPAGTGLGSAGLEPSARPEADGPAWITPAEARSPDPLAATTAARAGPRQGAPGEGSVSRGTAPQALSNSDPPGSADLSALAQALLAQLAAAGALAGQAGSGSSPAASGQANTLTPQHPSAQAHQWQGFAVGAAPGNACGPGATHPGAYPAVHSAAAAPWPWPGCMAPAPPWAAPGLGTPDPLRQPQAVAPQAQLPADSAALAALLQSLLHALSLSAAASPAAAAATPTEAASPAAAIPAAAAALTLQALLCALTTIYGSPAPAAGAAVQPPSRHTPDSEAVPDPVPGHRPSPDPGAERARRAALRASAAERHARALRSIQSLIRQPNGAHAQASVGLGDAPKGTPAPLTALQQAGKGRDRQEPDPEPASDPPRYPASPGAPGSGPAVERSPLAKLPRSRSDASAQTTEEIRERYGDLWAYTPGQSLGGSGGLVSVSVAAQPRSESSRDPDPERREGHLAGLARRALARSLSSERGWPEAGGRAASPGPETTVTPPERAPQQPGAHKRPVDVHFNPLFRSGEGEGVPGGSGAGSGDPHGAAGGRHEGREAGCGSGQEPWQGPAAGATPLSAALAAADVSEPLRRELLGLLARNLEEVQVRVPRGVLHAYFMCNAEPMPINEGVFRILASKHFA